MYAAGANAVSSTLTIPFYKFKIISNKFSDWKKIKFENVFFSHKLSKKIIINNISLTINRGDTIGIQGTTGSGKSTFADLFSGLLNPTEGTIKIVLNEKQKERKIFNDPSWFKEISYVPQKIFLLDTTIAKNIAFNFNEEEIDYELIKEVSKMARIDDYISTLDFGYNTRIGEQGITLSGGQQQRIAIARALYRKLSLIHI